jgi:hypothetical protein
MYPNTQICYFKILKFQYHPPPDVGVSLPSLVLCRNGERLCLWQLMAASFRLPILAGKAIFQLPVLAGNVETAERDGVQHQAAGQNGGFYFFYSHVTEGKAI